MDLLSLKIFCRLLDPSLESSGSLFVGSYILQLILHLPSQMAPHIRELVAAIVRRMQSSEIASLKSSLIVVLARLVFSFPSSIFCLVLLYNLISDPFDYVFHFYLLFCS